MTLSILSLLIVNLDVPVLAWRLVFWSGLIVSAIILGYRKLNEETNGKVLSSIEANQKIIFANTLITLSLVFVLSFLMPNIRKTPNPNFDVSMGPVLVEECAYDYAQGEICGEKDLNPEFIPRGENLVIGAILLLGVTYYFLYTSASKRLSTPVIGEVNGYEITHNAQLSGVDLSNQNLTKGRLGGADLSGANLSNTRLVLAHLHEANLSGANLSFANLRGADLIGANLKGADLTGARLREANLFRAIMPDGTTHT